MKEKQEFINLKLRLKEPWRLNKNVFIKEIKGERDRVLNFSLDLHTRKIREVIIFQNGIKDKYLQIYAENEENLIFLKDCRKIWLTDNEKLENFYNPKEPKKVIEIPKKETNINDQKTIKNTYIKIKNLTREESMASLAYWINLDIEDFLKQREEKMNPRYQSPIQNWNLIMNKQDYSEIKKTKISLNNTFYIEPTNYLLPGEYLIATVFGALFVRYHYDSWKSVRESREKFQTLEAMVQIENDELWIKRVPEKFRASDSFYRENFNKRYLFWLKMKWNIFKNYQTILIISSPVLAFIGIIVTILTKIF